MIQRIRGRQAFQRLARDGKRIRRRDLWCSWCPDSVTSTSVTPTRTTTRVAFALGRTLGPAVTRNRVRRRLRVLCQEADASGALPSGLLLLGANPSVIELTFEELRREFRELMTTLNAAAMSTSASPPSGLPSATVGYRP